MTITVTTGLPSDASSSAAGFTYSSLCSYLDTWLARGDISEQAPFFLSMFEDYLHYGTDADPPLRCREMEAVAVLTPDSDFSCMLPDDYLAFREVVENQAGKLPLVYLTSDQARSVYPTRYAGVPYHFSIIGEYLNPLPVTSNDIELTYYQKIPALTSVSPTNWLLEKNKSIYFRGALMMAADYIQNDVEFAKHAEFVRRLVAGMNAADAVGRYSRAGLSLRGPTP